MEHKQIEADSFEEFVELVAKDCLEGMDDASKTFLLEHPEPFYHHFGLGMYIRNRYLWGRDASKDKDPRIGNWIPDDLSPVIIQRMVQELQNSNS